jgi:hypothetical protein
MFGCGCVCVCGGGGGGGAACVHADHTHCRCYRCITIGHHWTHHKFNNHSLLSQVKGVPVPATLSPKMIPPSMRPGGGASAATAAPSMASPPPAAAPAAADDYLSIKERAVYNQLWLLAVPGGQTHMGPGEAVAFLSSSGLDNGVLGTIWDQADQVTNRSPCV